MAQGGKVGGQAQGNLLTQDNLKNWVMALLTVAFVTLYIIDLFGGIPDLTDGRAKILSHIEAIVFVIIGYYFGRSPVSRTRNRSKDRSQTRSRTRPRSREDGGTCPTDCRSDGDEIAKRSARPLSREYRKAPKAELAANLAGGPAQQDVQGIMRHTIVTALNILDS